MQHMRALLGPQLIAVYQRAAKELRAHGVEPVGYGMVSLPGAGARSGAAGEVASYGGAYADSVQGGYGHGPGYGPAYTPAAYGAPPPVYGRAGMGRGWAGDPGGGIDAGIQEALLTVDILRQMLAGGGDPYEAVRMGQIVSGPAPAGSRASSWADPYSGAPSAHAGQGRSHPPGYADYPAAGAEALEDIAQLERLVGRLTQTQPEQASRSALLGAQRSAYGVLRAGASESPASGADVVARMVENIAQDSRLLPPVQRAVQDLEPAICQLVQHDPRFFSDSNHPARRLLDELTQRSLAFTAEDAPGFSRFMRLVNEVVSHLTGCEITSAAPFETVLKALQTAWDAQEKKLQALRQAQEEQLLQTEQRQMLAEKIAAGIRALSGVEQVPADVMDFAAGPWADVVALAQTSDAGKNTDDPGSYVALVSDLFWSVQPDLARADPARLRALVPGLLATLRTGMQSIDYPQASNTAFLARLLNLHRSSLAASEKRPTLPPLPQQAPLLPDSPVQTQPPASADAPVDSASMPPEIETQFVVGAWIELTTNRRKVRTQLTWASPHHTLFLFMAADGSTQSMTRRMRDKLAAEGTLRVISAQPVVARAINALGVSAQTAAPTASRRGTPPTDD